MVKHFRDLRNYQFALKSAMIIFELTKKWPPEEHYSMTDQIRRSSRSVHANIAEAWRKRRYVAHFTSKLCDADGEAAETQSWLDSAFRCGYITEDTFNRLNNYYELICGGLVLMINDAAAWCQMPTIVKEMEPEYHIEESLNAG